MPAGVMLSLHGIRMRSEVSREKEREITTSPDTSTILRKGETTNIPVVQGDSSGAQNPWDILCTIHDTKAIAMPSKRFLQDMISLLHVV